MHALPKGSISVLIADKSAAVGERLCALLAEVPGLRVIGQTLTETDTLAQVAATQPTALVLDLQLAETDSLSLVRSVRALAPPCVVMILTNHTAEVFQDETRRSGADFFFHKATEFEEVVELLRGMAAITARQYDLADAQVKPLAPAGTAHSRPSQVTADRSAGNPADRNLSSL
jgi:DNA-binding NarL/FixJ family response regulator